MRNCYTRSNLFFDLKESFFIFKKIISKFYYLNLLFKNNWVFFFRIEDFFFKDIGFLGNIFRFDFSYFYFSFKNFSFLLHTLKIFLISLKNVKLKLKKSKKKLKEKVKFFLLFKKGLFFFLKSYEKFLFFSSNFI
jgi:hypothetical protein